MLTHVRLNRKRSAGFGLIEVMVALVIGMFGVMVMMQVLALSEEQKRTTTSGGDAMNEGVIALYSLQSEIRMGGYGIADAKLLGCNLQLRAGVTLNGLAPMTINPPAITGNDANTDTLRVFYSNSNGTPQGDSVITTGNNIQTPSAFTANDWVVVTPATRASPCNLILEQVSNVSGKVLTLKSGATLAKGSTVFNLGQSFRAVGYAIRNGDLTVCDYTDATKNCSQSGSWASIANNIVSLRAQYGRDTAAGAMDDEVDAYDESTPDDAVTPDTSCNWARISAVRLALVARSAQFEKTAVTPAAPVWAGTYANNPAGSTASPIVLTSNADWQNYRYKVFQTTVAIRNISWMGVLPGC